MCKTCSIENLRYPLLLDSTMLTHFKKLLKKSLGLKERHSFDEKKTPAPHSETESKGNENSTNTNKTGSAQGKSDQVRDIHSELQASQPILILYKFDACPYCKRVQRKIDELHLSDKIEMRDTRMEPEWRKDLKNRTGRTQVPCLFIDGTPMFESLDIIDFLQSQFTITS